MDYPGIQIFFASMVSTLAGNVSGVADLIGPFTPEPPIPDFGLDAVALGPEGQVLFSTNEAFFSESLGVLPLS